MADTKKKPSQAAAKTGTQRAAKTGTKQAAKKKSTQPSNTSRKSSAAKSSAAKTAAPRRREIGALVCLVLALFCLLGYFGIDAIFISWSRVLICGLIGWGYYTMVPILVLCAAVLGLHRGKPVRFRVFCSVMIAVMFAATVHLFACKTQYEWAWKMIPALFSDGVAVKCGGVFGGLLAISCSALFSRIGALLFFVALVVFFAMSVLEIGLQDVVDKIRSRERREYVREEESVPFIEDIRPHHSTMKPSEIDIPVDEPAGKSAEKPKKAEKKQTFFNSVPNVKTPDQVLSESSRAEAFKPAAETAKPELKTEKTEKRQEAEQWHTYTYTPAPQQKTEPKQETKTGFRIEGSEIGPMHPVTAQHTETAHTEAQHTETVQHTEAQPAEAAHTEDTHTAAQPAFEAQAVPVQQVAAEGAAQVHTQAAFAEKESYSAPTQPKAAEGGKVNRQEIEAAGAEIEQNINETLSMDIPEYAYPSPELLNEPKHDSYANGVQEVRQNAERLENTVRSFGVNAKISNITRGPTVTRYEFELEQGVKLSKITNLADDIALALGASGVRIAPIPDKSSMVGIEVPNKSVSTVYLREIIESDEFKNSKSKVTFALGKDIGGNCVCGNIEKLPHMLIAGTTGSGKSVCMNSLIISLLYKAKPDEVRLIMVDPKMIELGIYNGIPHLLIPVVTDPKKAAGALQWAVSEMMKRYKLFSEVGARDIAGYNSICEKEEDRAKLPQIVIVIDELADLMLVAAKEVEESICRIAQMARAAGMHLIIATQRPSADVITGIMKANIPSRIAFAVASQLESRIIMDTQGAEKLIGRGDMLYFPLGAGKPMRVQGTFIDTPEVEAVVNFIKQSSSADYNEDVINEINKNAEEKTKLPGTVAAADAPAEQDAGDELFPAAVEVVLDSGQASVSMLQRRLKLGYSRAARLVDQMEERGIVGPFEGSKPRALLITRAQWNEMNGAAPAEEEAPQQEEVQELPEETEQFPHQLEAVQEGSFRFVPEEGAGANE